MNAIVKPAFPPTARERGKVAPAKFAHVVMNTPRYRAMVAWYCTVLEAVPVFESDMLTFITYDDEHHRIAFINSPGLADKSKSSAGVHHLAYTYEGLGDLIATYERLKGAGILPAWTLNHGPTTSMYYVDPDGTAIELQVDNFATLAESADYFLRPEFAENPIGVEFDPEDLLAQVRAGVPEAELKRRKPGPVAPIRV